MRTTVERLSRLQELEITHNEAKILHGEHRDMEAIDAEIISLRESLNVDVLARYDRLSKHGLGVVRLTNGMCMGCNMAVPQGDLNRMKSSKADPICPNCGRYIVVN